ncbi:hypothetical protein [uncultured Duncaniella sp.]|uniref:hypothetical protein n=1 Tax=uncultured Duncaniella sp. TaxID=2768039 RepID=UPI00266F6809|nr:hypothetical protein [uncultured Duncaniella sp.]
MTKLTHRILQPQRMLRPPGTPWHIHFARYLGRPLTTVEISVISPLERQRATGSSSPVFVLDPPGFDSAPLLMKYQEYRLSNLSRAEGVLIIPVSDLRDHPRRQLPGNIYLITHSHPDFIRGRSPYCTLLLNVERYSKYSPWCSNTRRWERLLTAVLPTLTPSGFVIIHASSGKVPPPLPSPSSSVTEASVISDVNHPRQRTRRPRRRKPPAIPQAIATLRPSSETISPVSRTSVLKEIVISVPSSTLVISVSAYSHLSEMRGQFTVCRYTPPPHSLKRCAVLRSPKLNRPARAN